MGEITTIPWCDHTFNPWWGCTEAGPGCASCYARESDHGWGGDHWGQGKPRRYFGDDHWREPVRWNRAAEAAGQRRHVFCASMADVFDNEVDQSHRERLWALICATPWLDWLVVTKRIPNALKMLPVDWGDGYPNVWLISTVVTQAEADRDIPRLAAIPARIHGLSIEPQLEAIDLSRFALDSRWWVICGGESGAQARPFRLDWARALRDRCAATGTAFFMKQIGSAPEGVRRAGKGEDPGEWSEDLRVRQFPVPTVAVAPTEPASALLPVMPLLPHLPRADDRLDTRVVSHNPSSAAAPNDANDDRDTLVPKGKRRTDYDPDALPIHSDETMAAIWYGQEAGKALQRGETWEHWREVGRALELGVRDLMHALGINDRQQAGRKWSEPFGDWLRRYEFDWIDKGARARLLDCMANIEAIEAWRDKLRETDRKKLAPMEPPRCDLGALARQPAP
jgi:protein gp37